MSTTIERMERANDFERKVYDKFGDKRSQTEYVAEYLDMYGSITALEALSAFGCFRLAARIADLRADGYNITTDMVRGKKSYAIYRMEEEDEEVQSNY